MPKPVLFCRAFLAALFVSLTAAAAVAAPACGGRDLLVDLKRSAPDTYARLQAEAAAIANGEGLLWRIEAPDAAPSYLFGTIHITDERVTDLPPPVAAALKESRRVAVESVDAMDRKKLASQLGALKGLMFFEDGRSLAQHLSESRRAALADALKAVGGKVEALGAMKPWLVATTLALPPCESARQEELPVVDQIIADRGKKEGLPVISLETVREQLSAFNGIPVDLQAEYLIASVRLFPRLEDLFATMARLYLERRSGMIEVLSRDLGDETDISKAGYDAFNDHLVNRRNKVMIARIKPLVEEGGAFIAVGALHLIGETGLVALLRDQGYTVSRVY